MSDQTPYSSYPDGPQWQNQPQGGYPPSSGPYTPPPYSQPQPGFAPQAGSYPPQQPYAPAQYQQPGYAPQPGFVAVPVSEPGAGMAVASLVLGILSIVTFWAWFLVVPLSVVGIIMGALGRRSISRRGLAIAGLICSIIGLAVFLIVYIAIGVWWHSVTSQY
jgi:hypothetical protein